MSSPTGSYEHRTWWGVHDLTERLTNPAFLEAAITCAFALGAADGSVSPEEYDALLDRLLILGDVDRDAADEHLTTAANLLERDGDGALIAKAAAALVDHGAAEAALMLALAVALADDDFATSEREVATRLATALRLGSLDLDAAVAIVRG